MNVKVNLPFCKFKGVLILVSKGYLSRSTHVVSWSGPDQFDALMVFLKEIFENSYFEKQSEDSKKACKNCKELILLSVQSTLKPGSRGVCNIN